MVQYVGVGWQHFLTVGWQNHLGGGMAKYFWHGKTIEGKVAKYILGVAWQIFQDGLPKKFVMV